MLINFSQKNLDDTYPKKIYQINYEEKKIWSNPNQSNQIIELFSKKM